jgi:hypothetical protein
MMKGKTMPAKYTESVNVRSLQGDIDKARSLDDSRVAAVLARVPDHISARVRAHIEGDDADWLVSASVANTLSHLAAIADGKPSKLVGVTLAKKNGEQADDLDDPTDGEPCDDDDDDEDDDEEERAQVASMIDASLAGVPSHRRAALRSELEAAAKRAPKGAAPAAASDPYRPILMGSDPAAERTELLAQLPKDLRAAGATMPSDVLEATIAGLKKGAAR